LLLPFIVFSALVSDLAAEAPEEDADPEPTLAGVYADRFLIGTCIGSGNLRDEAAVNNATMRFIPTQYNAVTPENCMKWGPIHPEPGRYDFAKADRLVDFAEAHGMKVFGHTLVWHNQTPDWVFEDDDGNDVTREVLIERMRDHIHTVVGRYKGRIHAWDVVNEATRNDRKNDADGPLRKSRWRSIIGDDYLAMAYRFAHEADPDAILIYNDYGLVNDTKRAQYIAVVKQLLADGVPVHAVGLQGHWGPWHPQEPKLRRMLEEIGGLGLPMHITELDHNLLHGIKKEEDPYADGLPDDIAQKQAAMYATWFKVFADHADRIDRVSFWGPHDGQTWLRHWPKGVKRAQYPLLFNEQMQPKPAFAAAIDPEGFLADHSDQESKDE